MAYGLETRVPFMDNDLVNFAMTLPVNLKVKNLKKPERLDENLQGNKPQTYFVKTNDGKYLLRKTMAKHVPENVIQGSKQGFSSPDASWFKGESIDFVRQNLLDSKSNLYTIFDFESTKELVNDHLLGNRNRRLMVWSLLYLKELMDHS
jgi:asparagine synthase (glutamine-hydrolysing)